MPPRRSPAADSLTPADLAALTEALASGKRATVYLREGTPSLGLDAGASARVVSVSGSTVTIRPRGVDDELPYEADELVRTKPKPPKPKATTPTVPTNSPTVPTNSPTVPTNSPSGPRPKPAEAKRSGTKTGTTATTSSTKPSTRTKAAPKRAPKSVTVTIHGSADNEWWVSVARGGRKPGQSRSVTPDAVEGALGELDDYAALTAAKSILDAAREAAERRVEELSRELAAAQEALDALTPK
ncbi:hypothetical protein GOARA_090_00070 [Gordonia araii NBRC 100433]|uniref:Translation initiation factor n=1 Tax=Gordonia araii NBRC 100433 TaxID=1073574 RepID=G7H7Q0_9ACTN|nr:DUF6319 family protein [Gordonia araii]NNG99113.1 DNA-binding protein [Gordonia araii NBRC 100433]GAB11875.1 hypothetical protein GOARA_090_00070 [Gordonia araii NBRC 100433]